MNKTLLILIPVIVIAIIRLRPFDLVFRPLYTLVHELSHAIIALLFGIKIKKIVLNKDFSGTCTTINGSKIAQFFISIAGYTLSGLLGYFVILTLDANVSKIGFYAFIVLNIIALILYIRGQFSIIWVISFVGVNLLFVLVPWFGNWYAYILYLYCCILIIENIFACCSIVYLSFSKKNKAGDCTILKKTTHIPSFVWSILFLIFSIYISVKAIEHISILSA